MSAGYQAVAPRLRRSLLNGKERGYQRTVRQIRERYYYVTVEEHRPRAGDYPNAPPENLRTSVRQS